jgi:hypothetical protein
LAKSEGRDAGAVGGKRENGFRFAAETCENNEPTFL